MIFLLVGEGARKNFWMGGPSFKVVFFFRSSSFLIFEQLETHWVQQGNTLGAAMATKKLETEFINLKKEFLELQKLIQNLIDKHGDIKKIYEKFIQKQKRGNFKCRNYGEKFDILRKLQDHKEEDCPIDSVKYGECEKCFKDKKELQDHTDKMNKKFGFDECDKVFRFEALLEKHKEAAHEDVELFCPYYNNDKDCPFDDECIYLHEESENCK